MRSVFVPILALVLFWACDTNTKTVDACGDGFLDPGEACDGGQMTATTCVELGYYEQTDTLTCRSDCTFDLSVCIGGRCGDGTIQSIHGETCDGENLAGATCANQGLGGGTLACNAYCRLDISRCELTAQCGDGAAASPYEPCDGTDLGDQTCATLGFHRGVLACKSDCTGFDTSGCTNCGNGTVDDGEPCDGTNLEGQTCESLGYSGGALSCSPSCVFDLSQCEAPVTCGNGQLDTGEQCDGALLNGATCVTRGFLGGQLGCRPNCAFDTTGCTNCGNGQLDAQEACDGANLDGQSCATQGWHGGMLACAVDCAFDTTECTNCGNGQLDAQEICDGANLAGATCQSLGYSPRGGALACTSSCQLNMAACIPKSANANLASLTVTSGTLTPAFSATTTTYTVTVPLAVTSLTVAGTAADAPWATVAVAPAQPMALVEGANPVTVTVTAEDGTQKAYSVTVTQSPNYESPTIGTLIYVPAGTFQRDVTATNLSTVSAFRMSRNEITRTQWMAVTGWADPSLAASSSGMSDPVQTVSWYDAIAFCNKLSLLEGLTPVYTVGSVDFTTLTYAQVPTTDNATWNATTANWAANGYRLPTEMEWMWAAMGADKANPGVTNTTGYTKAFAGSTGLNNLDDYAWYATNSGNKSHPAGTRLANELGIHDLSGNIYEWAWDRYATPYPAGPLTDYRGPATGVSRILRGGNWYHNASRCTVVDRGFNPPHDRYHFIGFRVVRP